MGGDNDPLDVCEIGLRQIATAQVRPVKVRRPSTPCHACLSKTEEAAALCSAARRSPA